MGNSKTDLPDNAVEPNIDPGAQGETDSQPTTEAEVYVNEKIRQAYEKAKQLYNEARERYNESPRLQKLSYQGKFMPAFWTVAGIFSLLVNIVLLGLLISMGHQIFQLKSALAKGVTGVYDGLTLMDQAHIVTTVPVETTVQLQDNLPVVFNLPIKQSTQLQMVQGANLPGASILLNGTWVPTNLTLPAGTPIQVNMDMTIPVSQSVPVDVTVPVSLLVPLDLAVDQTDLHQSIIGIQGAIQPYKEFMASSFNSSKDISLCQKWWAGWLCGAVFGK